MKNTFKEAKFCNIDYKIQLIFLQPQNDNNNHYLTYNIEYLMDYKHPINQTLHSTW